jgi:hypothetical protein
MQDNATQESISNTDTVNAIGKSGLKIFSYQNF